MLPIAEQPSAEHTAEPRELLKARRLEDFNKSPTPLAKKERSWSKLRQELLGVPVHGWGLFGRKRRTIYQSCCDGTVKHSRATAVTFQQENIARTNRPHIGITYLLVATITGTNTTIVVGAVLVVSRSDIAEC
jgi:hypothetical protein